jgi:hypothetical protein
MILGYFVLPDWESKSHDERVGRQHECHLMNTAPQHTWYDTLFLPTTAMRYRRHLVCRHVHGRPLHGGRHLYHPKRSVGFSGGSRRTYSTRPHPVVKTSIFQETDAPCHSAGSLQREGYRGENDGTTKHGQVES